MAVGIYPTVRNIERRNVPLAAARPTSRITVTARNGTRSRFAFFRTNPVFGIGDDVIPRIKPEMNANTGIRK